MRAIFDANVLVTALLSRTGAPAQLVELWLGGAFELVACETLLGEVRRTLRAPKINRRVAAEDADDFVRVLQELADLVPDAEGEPPVRSADPGDDYLLAVAAREGAQLVSGDLHVLALGDRLPISTPGDFLDELERR